MLNEKERTILETSLKMVLSSFLSDNLASNKELRDFVLKEATYEQLLNATFNSSPRKRLPLELLEGIALYSVVHHMKPIADGYVYNDLTIYGMIQNALNKARDIAKKYPGVKTFAKAGGVAIGASVAAAYVYNNILAKYIAKCKSVGVKDLPNCIKQVKIETIKTTIRSLKISQQSCKHIQYAEDSDICFREYQNQIDQLYNKMTRISGKLVESIELNEFQLMTPSNRNSMEKLIKRITNWEKQLEKLKGSKAADDAINMLKEKIESARRAIGYYNKQKLVNSNA